ncbi:MAG: hypothetical protein NTW87_34070 [Planctomycetota bacterium]|nr:hypothetical protein [Planctomycetota bacterium]
MKKTIILAILVMAGGGYYLYTEFANPYGVEPGHPLGKMEKMDQTLQKLGLQELSAKDYAAQLAYLPQEEQELRDKGVVSVVHTYGYADEVERRKTGDVLKIMLDKSGKVRAVAAKFMFNSENMRQTYVSAMMLRMWTTHSGSDMPAFIGYAGGDRIGTFATGEVEGKWYKLGARDRTDEMIVWVK